MISSLWRVARKYYKTTSEVGPAVANTAAYYPVVMDTRTGGAQQTIHDLTLTPYNSGTNVSPGAGLYVVGLGSPDISVIHCEIVQSCILADSGARPVVHDVTGNTNVTNVVYLTPTVSSFEGHALVAGGATNSVKNALLNETVTTDAQL